MSGRAQVKAEASFTPSSGHNSERTSPLGHTSALKNVHLSQKRLVSHTMFAKAIQRVPSHNCLFPVQAKLTINKPGDQYEQEADRIADQVMMIPEPRLQRQAKSEEKDEEETLQTKPLSSQITAPVQMQEDAYEKEEEEEIIQAKANSGRKPIFSPHQQDRISSLRSRGHPLPSSTRTFFEQQFGHNFRAVRIHSDANDAESARSMHARAYTVGKDMAFGAGQYAPFTDEGRRLLAHELVHVIQQSSASERKGYREINAANPADESNRTKYSVSSLPSVSIKPKGILPTVQRQREGHNKRINRLESTSYAGARIEAKRIFWALLPGRDRDITRRTISRFHGFTHPQVRQVLSIWRRYYSTDLVQLVEMRIGREWGEAIRGRIYGSEEHLRTVVVPEQHGKEVAESERKKRQEVERIAKLELEKPSSELGRFIREKFYNFSKDKQQSIQGLLYFVYEQRQEYHGWLRPGQFYEKFDRRYFLGASGGQTIWIDKQMKVFTLPEREDLLEGMIRGVVSAAPWVPILKGVAIFATIVAGGLVLPLGTIVAIGRAGIIALAEEWALASGVLRIIGTRALAFYLSNPIVVNEIGLFTVGLIVSVEGDIPGLINAIKEDKTQALPILMEALILHGSIQPPKGSSRAFNVRTQILPKSQQTTPRHTLLRLTSKPNISASKKQIVKPELMRGNRLRTQKPSKLAAKPTIQNIPHLWTAKEIFSDLGGSNTGYTIEVVDDSMIDNFSGQSRGRILKQEHIGGASTNTSAKKIEVHVDIIKNGLTRDWGAKLNPRQVIAHEIGHALLNGGECAYASRVGANISGLTEAERIGLLDDAVYIASRTMYPAPISIDKLKLPRGYKPPKIEKP